MLSIVLYTIAGVFLMHFFGYGISRFSLPQKLQPFSVLFAPWVTTVAVIFSMVILGRVGISTKFITIGLGSLMTTISIYAIIKFGLSRADLPSKAVLAMSVLIIFFSLQPLLFLQGFLTTLSLGSNDAKAFAAVPDFLMTHTVKESFEEQNNNEVYTLFSFGWRVGPSVLMAFFQKILGLAGYQILTIIQAILLGTTIPLLYILFRLISQDKNHWVALVYALSVATNVNLIYYLYHNFIGQIVFLGLSALCTILLLVYDAKLYAAKKAEFVFNRYDFFIGMVIAVVFFSYHEAAVFILLPMGLNVLFHLIFKKKPFLWLVAYTKSFLITFLLAFPTIFHSLRFAIFYRSGDFNAPIGWQPFRQVGSSFINPFEMTSLYSIHNFPSLPLIISSFLSLCVICLIIYGLRKSANKILINSFAITYLIFFILLALVRPNFWFYDRAVSYSIPILMALFMIGIISLVSKRKGLVSYALIILIWISVINAGFLMKRYWRENLAVEKWMTTLTHMPKVAGSTIYSEQVFSPNLPIWKELWAEYFIESDINFITSLEYKQMNKKISDDDLILISKVPKYTPLMNLLLNNIVWENSYYKLGRICISDKCLQDSKKGLSEIIFGRSDYEDTLLEAGWSLNEGESRWVVGDEAHLRLVSKIVSRRLIVELRTFRKPQRMILSVDDKKIASAEISENWKQYNFPVILAPGVHKIAFRFSNTYQPSTYGQSLDNRTLSANFRKILLN